MIKSQSARRLIEQFETKIRSCFRCFPIQPKNGISIITIDRLGPGEFEMRAECQDCGFVFTIIASRRCGTCGQKARDGFATVSSSFDDMARGNKERERDDRTRANARRGK